MNLIIYVEGGVVQCVRSDSEDIEVSVFDVDNLSAGDDFGEKSFSSRKEIHEFWDYETSKNYPYTLL